jgi:hypothetical protein
MADITAKVTTALASVWATGAAEKMRSNGVVFALLNVPAGQTGCSFSASTDLITLSASQAWPTRTRVRFEPSNPFGSPPSISPLTAGTDYWLIKVGESTTEFQVASSLSNAIANTFIQLPTVAANNYNVIVQKPAETWPIAELVHWEINHAVYTSRFEIPVSLPNPTVSGSISSQRLVLATIDNTDAATFTYNAIALIDGSATPGNTTGTVLSANLQESGFPPSAYSVSIAQGEQREISYLLELQSSV